MRGLANANGEYRHKNKRKSQFNNLVLYPTKKKYIVYRPNIYASKINNELRENIKIVHQNKDAKFKRNNSKMKV